MESDLRISLMGKQDLVWRMRTASLTFYNRKKRYDGYSHNHFGEI